MEAKGKILIVDDDENFRRAVKPPLSEEGYYVQTVENGIQCLERLKETSFDLLLTDLKMEPMDGFQVLKKSHIISPETIVIVITGFATIETAIEAIKLGAYDYLTKPCSNDELVIKVNRAFDKKTSDQEIRFLRENLEEKYSFHNIISKNNQMQNIFKQITRIGETDTTVLIQGETGTGKELIAKAIHYNSVRKEKPFVTVSCAALTETLLESELFGHEKGAFTGAFKQKMGRFEMANGGTLFLDEVGDIPASIQVKLLRVLEEKSFERVGGTETIKTDVRLIAATNQPLQKLIENGSFRKDLYYRLNIFPITLPLLKERKDDIPLLVTHFLKKYSQDRIKNISPDALNTLLKYDWPGNIRELENVIERSVLLETTDVLIKILLSQEEVPQKAMKSEIVYDLPYREFINNILEDVEREYFSRLLTKYEGNIQLVADESKLDRKTIYRKMQSYGFKKEDFK